MNIFKIRAQNSVRMKSAILHPILFCVILFLGEAATSVQAASHTLELNQVTERVIRPAVENLKIATSRDTNLAAWLPLLQVTTTTASHTGPNAYTTNENNLPVVYIDWQFILKCFQAADFAGLIMSNPPGDVLAEAGRQYGVSMRDAILNNRPVPSIKADLNRLPLSQAHHVSAEQMSHLSFGAAIQFIVLHEIAHHQLEHFTRDPNNLAESRQWELDADSWAIRKMQHLGFGLDPLTAVLGAFSIEEALKRQAGVLPPVEQSTHPSWEQRQNNLLRFDTRKPSTFGNWINIIEVSADAYTGRFYANEIVVPRTPMPGVMAQFRQFGNLVQMPVEHGADGSIRVYGRTPTDMSEIIVNNIDSLYPDLRITHTDVRTGQSSVLNTRGYQADMAYIFSSPVTGFRNFTVGDVMQLDPMNVFENFLLQVETNPNVVQRAKRIQSTMLTEYNNILLRYAKGHISMPVAQTRIQSNAQSKSNEMRNLLGAQRFSRLQQIMLSSTMTQDALNRLLNQ